VSNRVSNSAPPPTEAIFDVFELKKQPVIVHYCHTAEGFSTKPTWIKAINNKQYASWPGLTSAIVQKILLRVRRNIEGTCQKVQVLGIEIHQESDRSSRVRTRNPSEHGCSDSNGGIESANQKKERDLYHNIRPSR